MNETGTLSKRKIVVRRIVRSLLIALGAILLLGLVAPFINAARFSGPLRNALENSLGRQVDFSAVHFTLFSGPGFSLDGVTISEDPRYGSEPFAYVPTLEARVRLDKLLFGQMRLASLRFDDPSLNLVKRSDGTWNVVTLIQRLSAPRRAPLNLFPALDISGARIDFKFGARKTVLYMLDSDLAIYPARSGKLYMQFSGSPARTDRAGNGFGHLRGSANWYLNANSKANQLEADITLDPSNLSELTTLFQGHDVGVHGTVSSHARVEGPLNGLRVSGELRLADVHRWDLLSSSGEDWRVRYGGTLDLLGHSVDLQTAPSQTGEATPVALAVHVDNFLAQLNWSLAGHLEKAPVADLLPLAKRMGLLVPKDLTATGSVDGEIAYSSKGGLSGGISIHDATATLPQVPPLHATVVNATLSPDRVHFEPVALEPSAGTLQVSGDYYLFSPKVAASFHAEDFPAETLRTVTDAWFGAPESLTLLRDGTVTGDLSCTRDDVNPASWTGQFDFADATLRPSGLAGVLRHSEGHVSFDASTLEVTHFAAALGKEAISGSYRFNALAKRPERIRLEIHSADLADIENALEPALQPQSLLARLRVTRRSIPAWLGSRNMEGDVSIGQFSVEQTKLGALSSHFIWQGPVLELSSLQLKLPEGLLRARGAASLASYSPRFHFNASVSEFPWRGGLVNADGVFETSGTGADSLQHLRATGSFSGEDVNLSPDDVFDRVSGLFEFSFADGWPNLRLLKLEASDGETAWNGEASSQSDGKLIFDLERAGRQRRVVSSLLPETPTAVSSLFLIRRLR